MAVSRLLAAVFLWPTTATKAENYTSTKAQNFTATQAQYYSYDRSGRLIQVTYASGKIVRYTYDNNSNILSVEVLAEDLFLDGFE